MPTIDYEIKLNDSGRPCIDLPPDYPQIPENQFFALEMCRYILQKTHAGMNVPPFDQHTVDTMDASIRMIGQVSDEVARLLWHSMKAQGDATLAFGRWHVHVDTIEERDAIPEHGIVQDGKLYLREEGFIVFVLKGAQRFKLKDGTTNDNWVLMEE
jgi:hypothetical protein